jgi:hypothetical protein
MDEQRYMERQSDEEQYLESILAGSVLNEPFQPGIHDMLELSTLHNRASAAEQLSQDMHRQRSNTPPSNERAPYKIKAERYHTRKNRWLLSWRLELVALVMAIAALVATIITLYHYNHRPSPHWPARVSVNTLVSIYTTILSAGILLVTAEGLSQLKWSWFCSKDRLLKDIVIFDDASRGPWGSATLLCRVKLQYLIASLGALVTIFSLGTGPFAQQIIRYYPCTETLPHISALRPRSNCYDIPAQPVLIHANGVNFFQRGIAAGAQRSIYGGIFAAPQPPNAPCRSGNCTWTSEFDSIGLCSSCDDISKQLSFTHHYNHSNKADEPEQVLESSLPSGLSSNSSILFISEDVSYMPSIDSQYASASVRAPWEDRHNTSDGRNPVIVDFLVGKILGVDPEINPATNSVWPQCISKEAKTTWPCRGYEASRCRIYPCVKTCQYRLPVCRKFN